jgi:hypothetical protein
MATVTQMVMEIKRPNQSSGPNQSPGNTATATQNGDDNTSSGNRMEVVMLL